MSCQCTEDKEQIGNVIIGRNKVTCQECLDAQAKQAKQQRIQQIDGELQQIDFKSVRALREENIVRIAELEAQAVLLRNERASLV